MLKKLIVSLSLAGAVLLTGCASVPMATPEQDSKAKQFSTASDKANIYIYRNETMGSAVKMPLLLDGVSVGDTVAKTYILKQVSPGTHNIVSKTENDATLNLDAQAGKNYYVWQEVKMGVWAARSELHEVDASKGQKAIKECKLIK